MKSHHCFGLTIQTAKLNSSGKSASKGEEVLMFFSYVGVGAWVAFRTTEQRLRHAIRVNSVEWIHKRSNLTHGFQFWPQPQVKGESPPAPTEFSSVSESNRFIGPLEKLALARGGVWPKRDPAGFPSARKSDGPEQGPDKCRDEFGRGFSRRPKSKVTHGPGPAKEITKGLQFSKTRER
jgi:hypothetical protein